MLLAGDKPMTEMYLRQPGFTFSACRPFTKNKERIQKFKETGDLWYIYQNELGKACLQHDKTSGDFKDLTRRTASDRILRDKAFNIAKILKDDRYHRGLTLMVCKFLNKKASGDAVKNENMINQRSLNLTTQELAEELHKPVTRMYEKRKV